LAEAIEAYMAQGGTIDVVPAGETAEKGLEAEGKSTDADAQAQLASKVEQLKGLVAKGAGVSALQYTLRMNRKEIKRLATEHGLKIHYSRPVRGSRLPCADELPPGDDTIAGHAMHFSTLGYTVPEIAQLLELSVRDVWNIGKAYRFEFKNTALIDAPQLPLTEAPES
jgi:hypothetical protein